MFRPRFIALLLAFGTLVVYLPVRHYGFSFYDDTDYVTENPVVKGGLTWAGVKWAFTTWHAGNWHPLTWLSHMLDCQIFGMDAGLHHCVNMFFHAANAVLLFLLLYRLANLCAQSPARQAGALWPGAFVAALFAWHPLHVESVAWVAERKDVLSTFFGLLALLAYARFVAESRVQSPKSRFFYGLALLAFALGLMAKPMLVTLPFVMLLLDWWPLQRCNAATLRRRLIEKIPFFFLSAASCVVTFFAQRYGGAVVSLNTMPLPYRLENLPLVYMDYLAKLFWPARLGVLYPLREGISPFIAVAAVAVLMLISIAAWMGRRRRPYCLVGWLWFLGTLAPVNGLVQVGSTMIADRYTYFPSIGIFLAVALGAREAAGRFHFPRPAVAAAAGLALAACLVLTHRQVGYWRNDVALFSRAVAVSPDSELAHLNLGYALERIGWNDAAMAECRTALAISPNRFEARNNLGTLLWGAGQFDQALVEFQAALRVNPNYIPALDNLGTLFGDLGRFDEALQCYTNAARAAPHDWHAFFLMGRALLQQGRDAEAVLWFQRTVRLDPDNIQAMMFLAEVLASDENPEIRDGAAAYALAFKANTLAGGFQPDLLDVLAMAHAELGRFDDAQAAERTAVLLAKHYHLTNDADVLQQRLQLYKNRQPFRQFFTNVLFRDLPKN